MSTLGMHQLFPESNCNLLIDGYCAEFAALAFYCDGILPTHPTAEWQDQRLLPAGNKGNMDAKRGCEKFLVCLVKSSSKLFAPSKKCQYSFIWLSEGNIFYGAAPYNQNKDSQWIMDIVSLLPTKKETTAAEHSPHRKWLKRTNLTTCAMRDTPLAHRLDLPRSPTRHAQRINSNLYMAQYIVLVNIKNLYIAFWLLRLALIYNEKPTYAY